MILIFTKRTLLTFLLITFIILSGQAQRGSLLIKKKNKVDATFTIGAHLNLQDVNNDYYTGILAHVKKDSFSILNYRIITKGSPLGFVVFDTIYNGYTFFHKSDIVAMNRAKPKGYWFKIVGGLAVLGGAGMTVLQLVNGGRFNYDGADYAKNIALKGVIPFFAGIGIKKLYKTQYFFKRKYKIDLMQY